MEKTKVVSPIRLYPDKDADLIQTIDTLIGNGSFESSGALIKKVLRVYGQSILNNPIFNIEMAIQTISGDIQSCQATPSQSLPVANKKQVLAQEDEPPQWDI